MYLFRLLRGQADLLAVMVLIATTIVVGVGFLGLVYPNINDLVYQNDLRTTLYNEQSLLVLYKEYENNTHVCIGFLRIEPGKVSYALAYIVGDKVNNSAILFPLPQEASQGTVSYFPKTYCLINGDYYPCLERIDSVVYLPSEVVENYVAGGTPGLVCVIKQSSNARLLFFVTVDSKLYEVGRVEVYA
ncbi:MAG: hypothetical protein QXW36_00080 [Desulfurococcaceae archaeon]